ncbi:MAG: prolyl oligopeptidase family serine peptidase [Sideroxyarcus sp.]|nr:prolyl oligopeptidase family serine peptidase [Sideroxyarcus sp.]
MSLNFPSVLLLSFWVWLASFNVFAQSEFISTDTKLKKMVPVEVYGALPYASAASLSPDGRHLAMIMPRNGRNAFVIWDLDARGKSVVVQTDEYEPAWIEWKTNNRLIAEVRFNPPELITKPRIVNTKLIALDADGGKVENLIRNHLFKNYIAAKCSLANLLPQDKDHVLIAAYAYNSRMGRQKAKLELIRVNINTGVQERLDPHDERVLAWIADKEGSVRLRIYVDDKTRNIQMRSSADGDWRTFFSYEINSGKIFSPLVFVDGYADRIYVVSNHEGGERGLYEYDLNSNLFVRTVASGKQYAHSLIYQERMVGYKSPNGSLVYLADDFAQQINAVNKALPDSENEIADIRVDGKLVLVKIVKGNEPMTYWLLDWRGEKGEISPFVATYPDLAPSQIAPTRMVNYKARDGLEIEALLTLPLDEKPSSGNAPMPFVILPHGGPTSCNKPGFDYLVQFLASRGYGVFQPQFRGSCGYGMDFEKAGQQQWGLAMQNDVTDGTHWLVQQHIADPSRIAIVGKSGYGGYAALMGAIREKELYCGLVAISPITDIELLLKKSQNYLYSDANMPKHDMQRELMREISPVQNADHIGVPVLFVHGRKDFTVPSEHTERMVEAMQKSGKSAEVLYLDEADHYLSHGDDRLATLKALEKFLATHVPVK